MTSADRLQLHSVSVTVLKVVILAVQCDWARSLCAYGIIVHTWWLELGRRFYSEKVCTACSYINYGRACPFHRAPGNWFPVKSGPNRLLSREDQGRTL